MRLEPGQVWELAHDGELVPGLLLYRWEDVLPSRDGLPDHVALYWEVLDLGTGETFSATAKRWEDPRDLVGRRLL